MLAKLWQRLSGSDQALILMYHQVCEKRSDPWDLAVHPENFAAQLYYLRKNFNVVSTEELSDRVRKRKLTKNLLAITFDDGFADNYSNAAPMLEWLKLPATFYIPTNVVNTHQQFWWEDLQTIVLQSDELPKTVSLKLNDADFQFQFRRDNVLRGKLTQEIKYWRANMPIPNERIQLYYDLWKAIQPLPYARQCEAICEMKNWSVMRSSRSDNQVMTLKEIQSLSNNSLFTIGAHSVTHAKLGAQPVDDQNYEIRESKKILERWIGKPVKSFAYPYGNYTSETKKILDEAGFEYAVSTEPRLVKRSDDRFELPRIQVKNWNVNQISFAIRQVRK